MDSSAKHSFSTFQETLDQVDRGGEEEAGGRRGRGGEPDGLRRPLEPVPETGRDPGSVRETESGALGSPI